LNVNDLVCWAHRPLALVGHLAVERADPAALEQIAIAVKAGAEQAGVEFPARSSPNCRARARASQPLGLRSQCTNAKARSVDSI